MNEQASDSSPVADDEAQKEALRRGMAAMQGQAPFALLGDIHKSARRYGFLGDPKDALRLLDAMPEAEVHGHASIAECRVSSAKYMPSSSLGLNAKGKLA